MFRALSSGDRVRVFKSWPYCSGFFSFGFFFFLFFLSVPTVCSLSLSQCLLACALACFTTHHGEGAKIEESQKNPSSAVCEANTDIIAMCWQKGKKKTFLFRSLRRFPVSGRIFRSGNVVLVGVPGLIRWDPSLDSLRCPRQLLRPGLSLYVICVVLVT